MHTEEVKSKKHPAKKFYVPPDIMILREYATPIVETMRREYSARFRR